MALVRRRVWLAAGAGLLAAGAGWLLFLPIPLTWPARLALRLARAPDSAWWLRLDHAEFRWQWRDPQFAVRATGVTGGRGNRRLATVPEIVLLFPKADWARRHGLPGLVTLEDPVVDLDEAPADPGAGRAGPFGPATPALPGTAALAWMGRLPPEGRALVRVDHLDCRLLRNGRPIDAAVPLVQFGITRASARAVRLELDAHLREGSGAVLDLSAVVDPVARTLHLERGSATGGGIFLQVIRLDADWGARPSLDWELLGGGFAGSDWGVVAPEFGWPLPAPILGELTLDRFASHGSWRGRRRAGAVSSALLDAGGQAGIRIGPEPLTVEWTAGQGLGGPIRLNARTAPFNPAHWPGPVRLLLPVAPPDFPLSLAAEAEATTPGDWRLGRLEARGGPGRLRWPGSGAALAIRTIDLLLVATGRHQWRLARGEAVLGPESRVSLEGILTAGPGDELDATGSIQAIGISAPLIAAGLPPGHWPPPGGPLDLHRLQLARGSATFQARIRPLPSGGYLAGPARIAGEAHLALPVRLDLHGEAELAAAGDDAVVSFAIDPFRPATLPWQGPGPGLLGLIDLPVRVDGRVRLHPASRISTLEVRMTAGPGRVTLPLARPATWPVENLTLDAVLHPFAGEIAIRSLRLTCGPLRLSGEASGRLRPPYSSHVRLRLEPFALADGRALLAACGPAGVLPFALPEGRCDGADLEWSGQCPPGPGRCWEPGSLKGTLVFRDLAVSGAGFPGRLVADRLGLALDYPNVQAEAAELRGPGFRVPALSASWQGADRLRPLRASATAELDLGALTRGAVLPAGLTCRGSAAMRLDFRCSPAEGSGDAEAAVDLSRAILAIPGVPDLAPERMRATGRVDGWRGPGAPLSVAFGLQLAPRLGPTLDCDGRADFAGPESRLVQLELSRIQQGRTSLQARARIPSPTHAEFLIQGSCWEAAPWLRAALAWADAPAESPPSAPPAPVGAALAGGTVTAELACAEVVLGPGASLHNLRIAAGASQGRWDRVRLEADAPGNNPLTAEFRRAGGIQRLSLAAGDGPAWIRALASPWDGRPPDPGRYAALIAQAAKIPTLISRGKVSAEATLPSPGPIRLEATLDLRDAVLAQPPRIVQLLALKSRRTLPRAPLIHELALRRIGWDGREVRIEGLSLSGTGFLSHLSVARGTYRLADEAVTGVGNFFGVGFEVAGSRDRPELYLWDNALIRTLGHPVEFDFDPPSPADAAESGGR